MQFEIMHIHSVFLSIVLYCNDNQLNRTNLEKRKQYNTLDFI